MRAEHYHSRNAPELHAESGNDLTLGLGVRTTGGTSVSTAHHHLDVWGVYYASEMVRLAELTGKESFLEQAKILRLFTLQYMGDGELTLHGLRRGKEAENEAVFHCNWSWSKIGKKAS